MNTVPYKPNCMRCGQRQGSLFRYFDTPTARFRYCYDCAIDVWNEIREYLELKVDRSA